MKHITSLLLLWLLLVSLTAAKGFTQETIRIATGEYPPFYSENARNYGHVLHLVSEAFAQMNIKVEYGFFPWNRSLALAKHNSWDATCCWLKDPVKQQYFYFSDVVYSTEVVFFHLKSYPFDWRSYDDLTGIEIGTTVRYRYGGVFVDADHAGKLSLEIAATDEINFRKLLGGRIKIFPISRKVGYTLLADLFNVEETDLITHHPKVLVSNISRLLVSEKNPKSQYFIEMFNKGLKMLKASGEYEKYFIEAKFDDYISQ
ncbi:substrate-binding periplasmic protein [Thalassomonas actiniarum]|uniref:Transporter substrate-binding domain-containing protein n=1 Tax=Thalassomonas actiniarum TaxID=485447 RepID=A0AAF0C0N1_9GAMM|nr:transporter substrate-binding domain-containing protein [Thalassomonas actiniarum]WDD96937.1 transporter substrate-binding domain-containing protein [Thalassomonas actiniarum]